VPLWLNKLDLKDYLYNLYAIPVLSVRSFVMQQRVRQDKPGKKLPKRQRWFRPRALKKMTVEMDEVGVPGTEGGGCSCGLPRKRIWSRE
jgi:large subunit ribosomal protein L23